jgi:hypothetical protein
LLLVLHARTTPEKNALALPFQGSLYMPTARHLEKLLEPHLHLAPAPVLRVRFRFLDAFAQLETPVQLPEWLAPFFTSDILPANQFLTQLRAMQNHARATLGILRENAVDLVPELTRAMEALQRARSAAEPKRASELWQQQKAFQQQHARVTLEYVANLTHLLSLDYWDSRGAILPHALALGGENFYNRLLANTEIFEE